MSHATTSEIAVGTGELQIARRLPRQPVHTVRALLNGVSSDAALCRLNALACQAVRADLIYVATAKSPVPTPLCQHD